MSRGCLPSLALWYALVFSSGCVGGDRPCPASGAGAFTRRLDDERCGAVELGEGTFVGNFSSDRPLVLVGQGPDRTILDGGALDSVVKLFGVGVSRIENLSIRNGRALNGGGLFVERGDIELRNVRIADNYASGGGGGILVNAAESVIDWRDLEVTGNTVEGEENAVGGGIWLNGIREVSLDAVVISGNQVGGESFAPATGGGLALSCWDSDGSSAGATFAATALSITGNSVVPSRAAAAYGGGLDLDCGGITADISGNFAENRVSFLPASLETPPIPIGGAGARFSSNDGVTFTVDLHDVEFRGNALEGGAQVVQAEGGGVLVSGAEQFRLADATLVSNAVNVVGTAVASGGAVAVTGASVDVELERVAATENTVQVEAGRGWGAVVLEATSLTASVADSQISGNRVTSVGGFEGSLVEAVGAGGLRFSSNDGVTLTGSASLVRSEIANNVVEGEFASMAGGAGVWVEGLGDLVVEGTTLRGNVASAARSRDESGKIGIADGGGLLYVQSPAASAPTLRFTDVILDGNLISGGLGGGGGAAFQVPGSTVAEFEGLEVVGNEVQARPETSDALALAGGGGLRFSSNDGVTFTEPTVRIADATFANNVVDGQNLGGVRGGALWINGLSSLIDGARFETNAVLGSEALVTAGGAIAYSCAPMSGFTATLRRVVAVDNASSGYGGGVNAECAGSYLLESSAFVGNSTVDPSDGTAAFTGGAGARFSSNDGVTLVDAVNTTFGQNVLASSATVRMGAQLYLDASSGAEVQLRGYNLTLAGADDTPNGTVLGAYARDSSQVNVNLLHSVLSEGSSPGACALWTDVTSASTADSLGYNWTSSGCFASPAATDIAGGAAPAGAWASTTEAVPYFLPDAAGELVDGGDPAGCVGPGDVPLTVDALGNPRSGACDIGAVERQP
jgi:hypothetical protein